MRNAIYSRNNPKQLVFPDYVSLGLLSEAVNGRVSENSCC